MSNSMFNLSGKVVMVTGAGSGMGRAICEAVAEFGANVACVDIVEEPAKDTAELVKNVGAQVLTVQADVFEEADIKKMIEMTVKKFNTIDIVFAHAAAQDVTPAKIHETPVESWDRIASRYLRGIFMLMKNVFPLMMEKKSGNFITTAAGTGIWPLPPVGALHLATPYITAKTAVIMLTKIAAKQYGEYGIRANVICPGYHRTGTHLSKPQVMAEMEEFIVGVTPLKRVGLPEDIKGLAVYLASDASSFVTGQVFVEDGGFMG